MPQPIQSTLKNPPIYVVARGDRVILIFEHEATDPHDAAKKYNYNSFDIFRVADGKIHQMGKAFHLITARDRRF